MAPKAMLTDRAQGAEGHVQAGEDKTSEELCKVANAKCSVDAAAVSGFHV